MHADFEGWLRALEELLGAITEQNSEAAHRSGNHGHLTEETASDLHQLILSSLSDVRSSNLKEQLEEICHCCEAGPSSATVLANLLNKPHIKELIAASDTIGGSQYYPSLPDIPFEVDDDDGLAVKIVKILRRDEPLGATIKSDENGAVTIARVIAGSVAERTGCILEGDRLLEVNGVRVDGLEPREILGLLERKGASSVTFKLIPGEQKEDTDVTTGLHLRAMFDYDGRTDSMHPCPEASLSFGRGDILEILVCSDNLWWQAKNLGPGSLANEERRHHGSAGTSSRVGIIPSESLLVEKAAHGVNRGSTLSRTPTTRLENEGELRYESVIRLRPKEGQIRPIVLIGASGVGRNELRRRLTLAFPDKFSTAVPHTSRQPRPNEQQGVDYYFVTRPELEAMIQRGEMLEFGEFRGNYYGTAISSVKRAGQTGTPLLTPHPLALRTLRAKDFMPVVIFVQAPDKETFTKTRAALRSRWSRATSAASGSVSAACTGPRGFSEGEIDQIITTSDQLDRQLGHIFDARIVNSNLETSFAALTRLIHKFETYPSWVPVSWATRDLN
ncbi:unnamed protein product, partial [Mesorhabditis spiculigera]